MLGELCPETALLLRTDPTDLKSQHTDEISADLLEIGDNIIIRPGSTPPADGTIVEGSTTVNESSLTGESVPVLKNPGDSLLTGTMVLSSPVVVQVDSVGDETMLQQIVRAVGESQTEKAPIEELADKITAVFVPVIIYLSIIVSIVWLALSLSPNGIPASYLDENETGTAGRAFFALGFAIAVLAVACPCGIGLAAPAAQAVGVGMAAKVGILAQGGGVAFQLATQVDSVVFDKTGTLTQGHPSVVGIKLFSDDVWLLDAVRVIEQTSSHPLAAALVRYSEEQSVVDEKSSGGAVELIDIEEIAGQGVTGRIKVAGRTIPFRLGNQALMGDMTYSIRQQYTVEMWKLRGYSVVYFALSSAECTQVASKNTPSTFSMAAIFSIADPVRPEAMHVIAALERAGKKVFMLTGDNEATARAVGYELGLDLDRIFAGVLPHEKAQFIRDLKEKKTTRTGQWWWSRPRTRRSVVMFAGDGLNDSAAVAAADVG